MRSSAKLNLLCHLLIFVFVLPFELFHFCIILGLHNGLNTDSMIHNYWILTPTILPPLSVEIGKEG